LNPTDYGRQLVNHVQVRFLTDVKCVEPDIVAELKNVRSSVRNSNNQQVDGCAEPDTIAENFRDNFLKLYSHSNSTRAKELWEEYSAMCEAYRGLPIPNDDYFDTESVRKVELFSI